eukprot:1993932-Pleurochrysis_carterae.AAC.1
MGAKVNGSSHQLCSTLIDQATITLVDELSTQLRTTCVTQFLAHQTWPLYFSELPLPSRVQMIRALTYYGGSPVSHHSADCDDFTPLRVLPRRRKFELDLRTASINYDRLVPRKEALRTHENRALERDANIITPSNRKMGQTDQSAKLLFLMFALTR